jgi:hypothetical protein
MLCALFFVWVEGEEFGGILMATARGVAVDASIEGRHGVRGCAIGGDGIAVDRMDDIVAARGTRRGYLGESMGCEQVCEGVVGGHGLLASPLIIW